jgi:hypothetical protein
MKRLLRIAGGLLGLGLALAAAAAVALKILLPPEKARQLVVDSARKTLKRDVRLQGLSIGLFQGVVAEGLEVSEAPDFSAGVFAQASSFRLRLSLMPLLRKQIVVDSVVLEGMKLTLVRGKDKVLRLPGAAASAGSSRGEAAAPFQLAVRKASIKDSDVLFKDEAAGLQWAISGLSAQLSDFSLERSFSLETSFKAEGPAGKRPVKAAVSFAGRVDPAGGEVEKVSVVIRKLSVTQDGMTLKASGKAAAGPKPNAQLKLAFESEGVEFFAADVEVEAAPQGGLGQARFSAGTPGIGSRILDFLGAPKGISLPAGTAAGRLSFSGDELEVPELALKTEAGTVDVKARLKGMRQAKPDVRAEARLKLSLPALKAADLPWAQLPAGLSLPAARIGGLVRLDGQDVSLEDLGVETAQGRVSLGGRIRAAFSEKPRPELRADMKLELPAFESSGLSFTGLPPGLSLPASHLEGGVTLSPDEARFHGLRLKAGGTDLEVEGEVRGLGSKPTAGLMLKCRSFILEELARISALTRDLDLAGKGFFALGVSGTLEKPLLAGKLQFQGLGAVVGGLTLSQFSGLAKFDERRIDVPNVKGLLAGAELSMDLTVKDYAQAAAVDLRAELSRFDLGAFMAAKAAMMKGKKEVPGAQGVSSEGAAKRPPLRAKGRLAVAKLLHPNAAAQDAKLSWELEGITPDLKSLDGWAKLSVGAGSFNDLGLMAAQSPVMKVLVLPIVLLQKIGGIGGLRLFPDLNKIDFTEIGGDYAFQKGVMRIRDSHLFSEAVHATTTGSIDLPSEGLDLVVTAQVGRVAPIDFAVTGTFAKPVAKPKLAKFLAEPAKQLLQGIFKLP